MVLNNWRRHLLATAWKRGILGRQWLWVKKPTTLSFAERKKKRVQDMSHWALPRRVPRRPSQDATGWQPDGTGHWSKRGPASRSSSRPAGVAQGSLYSWLRRNERPIWRSHRKTEPYAVNFSSYEVSRRKQKFRGRTLERTVHRLQRWARNWLGCWKRRLGPRANTAGRDGSFHDFHLHPTTLGPQAQQKQWNVRKSLVS